MAKGKGQKLVAGMDILTVRHDSPTKAYVDNNGDYAPLQVNSNGILRVDASIGNEYGTAYKNFHYYQLNNGKIFVEELEKTFISEEEAIQYLDKLSESPTYKALYD